MSPVGELNWRKMPLEGTTLIEASAGTGKTFNIALLYLRLLVERGFAAKQILVTTFTDAAAQELKARIRQRLLSAERFASSPHATAKADSDPVAAYVDEQVDQRGRSALVACLRAALADIDQAPISTIHGFCRRVLSDFPFEAGASFVMGEVVDEAEILDDCLLDFWRRRFLSADADANDLALIAEQKITLNDMISRAKAVLSRPGTALDAPSKANLEPPAALRAPQGPKALRKLSGDASLLKSSTRALRQRLLKVADYLDQYEPGSDVFDDAGGLHKYLKPNELAKQANPNSVDALDQHPVIRMLRPWMAVQRQATKLPAIWLSIDAAEFARSELKRRLAQRNQITFNQMIDLVHERLCRGEDNALSTRLAKAWPAAMIDECQDTDRRQFEIFQSLHRAGQSIAGAKPTLILIGDPKQSIYRFRGGDIHAYLAARQGLPRERILSIRQNYRSHPNLLNALNELYELAGDAGFGASEIKYVRVREGRPESWPKADRSKRLLLRLMSGAGGDRDELALDACANDVAALINNSAKAGKQRVLPGHIAVLLDTNDQIQQLRERLVARSVPVAGAGKLDVLNTVWADDVQLLLHAMLHPNDSSVVRGALATRLLGMTADALQHLASEQPLWERQLSRFAHWRQLWEQRGVLAALESVVLEQAPRLLASHDGDRALTDLRHLAEVLQEQSTECFGSLELYSWLVKARLESESNPESAEELQLRIESDAQRVQLMTIHASKGLQFPVVFVPMTWRYRWPHNSDVRRHMASFHDHQGILRLDLGSADFDQNKALEHRESLQERMRLLYVALTRAVKASYIYAFDDLEPTTDLAQHERGALDILLAAALASCASASSDGTWSALSKAVPSLGIEEKPLIDTHMRLPEKKVQTRAARVPLPAKRPYFGLYSFTSLVRNATASLEPPFAAEDEGEETTVEAPAAESSSATHSELLKLQDIKGPRFGNAVHQLLEAGPGRTRYAGQTERIKQALEGEGIRLPKSREKSTLSAIAEVLDRTLECELAPGLRLNSLGEHRQKAEFEFAFAIEGARWDRVQAALDQHGIGHWWPVATGPMVLNGLMKGFVDLVFESNGRFNILDYKTNLLGIRTEDYARLSLEQAMQDHHYGLQALVYTVAVHRYLGQRMADYDPDKHLGDAWYLFVRAVGLGAGLGVWRHRFPIPLIETVDALFQAKEPSCQ